MTSAPGLASILSAKSDRLAPWRIWMTVVPSPRGTLTPPIDGACISSNSMRLARLDLRARPGRPPPRPKAPWVPPRPPGPPRKPPPPPGRPPKPPPAPAPPPPGRAPAATGTGATARRDAHRDGPPPSGRASCPGSGGRHRGADRPHRHAAAGTAGTGARAALRTRHPLAGGEGVVAGARRGLAGAAHALARGERVVARARGARAGCARAGSALAGATLTGGGGHGRGGLRGAERPEPGRRSRSRGGPGPPARAAGGRSAGRGRGRPGPACRRRRGGCRRGGPPEPTEPPAAAGPAAGGRACSRRGGLLWRGAFLAAAGAAALGASAGNFSLYRRTTGVSIVELALLTYSPMPLRRSRRTLLVTPSSLASALTRTLDTFLLSRSVLCCADRRYSWGVLIAEYSSGAHQRQTRFRFLLSDGGSCSWALTQSVDRGVVGRRAAAQRAPERPAADGEVEARDDRVQRGATPRSTALGVRHDDRDAVRAGPEDHSQECRPAIRPTTPDAGAHRVPGPESSPVGPHQSTAYGRWGASSVRSGAAAAPSVSGRMSIRQPVSLAASRAFWPSRPMASESW